ncbi:LisH domain-containing protein armc9, partial [Quaeritorhiza haematococci]
MISLDADREIELNDIVREYLVFAEYPATVATFDGESLKRGRPSRYLGNGGETNTDTGRGEGDQAGGNALENAKFEEIENRFLIHFRDGDRDSFFSLWDDHFPPDVRAHEPLYQKIEFMLSIYFAVFPIHGSVGPVAARKQSLPHTMSTFKTFLETRGSEISKTTQFLPYYALPYVPDPRTHPSFAEIFTEVWVVELEERMRGFLRQALKAMDRPRLMKMMGAGAEDLRNSPEFK